MKAGDPVGGPVQQGGDLVLPIRWERIEGGGLFNVSVHRARVPGGWLVTRGKSGGMTYVPDPGWRWRVR